ncbi:uncharacterized protein MEPE_05355 [Melanopsichium pennsylvanicum]|uniref:Uncharacterized protein n=1 Tax=Melanopsichium pennsylvanicum TaxID=63383 RepID=A0AAJ4XRM8_9BASI|nr:uncharacterized protein MEPE_05355 [Melanopsichium pennsylvanicum]
MARWALCDWLEIYFFLATLGSDKSANQDEGIKREIGVEWAVEGAERAYDRKSDD